MKFSFTTHLLMVSLLMLLVCLATSVFVGIAILAGIVAETYGVIIGIAWWFVALATVLATGAHIGEMWNGQ